MTVFNALLITIHVISSIVETAQSCSNFNCSLKEEQQELCIEIKQAHQPPAYLPLNGCALKEFICDQGNIKPTFVNIDKCFKTSPPMRVRRAYTLKEDSEQVTTALNIDRNNLEQCPKECPLPSQMVCARCTHGIYRTFLSECHVRQYQCRSNEKLELVSHRACYGSAPYVMGEEEPQHHHKMLHLGPDKIHKELYQIHENAFTVPQEQHNTPKPTVHVTWPSRRTRPKSTMPNTVTTTTKRSSNPKITATQTTTVKMAIGTTKSDYMSTLDDISDTAPTQTTTAEDQYNDNEEDVVRIDVDICPNDEDQEDTVPVPKTCSSNTTSIYSHDYMKVDLHPDNIGDGSPVWMVYNKGRKITSALRADAGLVVGCNAYAGLDYSGRVVVRNKNDNDFIGLVFGYRSHSQFYLVTWKAKSEKYWIGWPTVVTADAGLHIKRVDSKTGPGPYLRNALYSTKSVKDEVTLLWQDPNKQGWKHLIIYNWQLIHRPHIGLIRVKVYRGQKLIVDSGNVFDKIREGGRIGVYAFSQENVEWTKMVFKCNDKIPYNLMSELPSELQAISVIDNDNRWSNDTMKIAKKIEN